MKREGGRCILDKLTIVSSTQLTVARVARWANSNVVTLI